MSRKPDFQMLVINAIGALDKIIDYRDEYPDEFKELPDDIQHALCLAEDAAAELSKIVGKC